MTRPIVDERLAEHVRAIEVIQDRHREKYRTEGMPEEPIRANVPELLAIWDRALDAIPARRRA